MRKILKFLLNIIVALILILAAAAILLAGYSAVMAGNWEQYSLDENAQGGEWTWIDDQPYHYETWGPDDGPVIVLIHGGYVEGSKTWENNATDIARSGVRVVAVDLAGLGLSSRNVDQDFTLTGQAQLVAMVLNELRIVNATVVGHDYGAAVALELAQIQPQFVGSIALIAPQLDATAWPSWRRWSSISFLRNGFAWALDCGGLFWKNRIASEFVDPSIAADYIETQRPMTQIDGTMNALVAIAQTEEPGLREQWQELDLPMMVIVGDSDPEIDADKIGDEFPNAELRIIENAGHMPQVEASTQVNRLLVQFSLED